MSVTVQTLVEWLLPRVEAGAVLAGRERRTLEAAAEVLLEGVDFELEDGELTRNVERFLGAHSSRRAWRARALLTLVEIAPPVLLRQRRFSRMSRAQRADLIRTRFIRGRHVWALCGRIRPLVYLGAYASPSAARHVGWIPVPERARFDGGAAPRAARMPPP